MTAAGAHSTPRWPLFYLERAMSWKSNKRYAAAKVLGVRAARTPWSVLREQLKEAPKEIQEEYEKILGPRPVEKD